MVKFRFEDLKIWQLAIEIADELFDLADQLEERKLYRFAEQLRGAGMSMSNNIAEGSGSSSKKEFTQFLNVRKTVNIRKRKHSNFASSEKTCKSGRACSTVKST